MSTAEQQPIRDRPGLGREAYARWRSSGVGAITEPLERQLMLALVGDVRGCRVLDVGCGHGELAVDLAIGRHSAAGAAFPALSARTPGHKAWRGRYAAMVFSRPSPDALPRRIAV